MFVFMHLYRWIAHTVARQSFGVVASLWALIFIFQLGSDTIRYCVQTAMGNEFLHIYIHCTQCYGHSNSIAQNQQFIALQGNRFCFTFAVAAAARHRLSFSWYAFRLHISNGNHYLAIWLFDLQQAHLTHSRCGIPFWMLRDGNQSIYRFLFGFCCWIEFYTRCIAIDFR